MEPIREYFSGDELARTLGIELIEVGEGRALATMRLQKCHMNGLGIVHGGAVFTLADFAFAAACNSRGHLSVGVSCSMSFMGSAKEGLLSAEAVEVEPHPRLATYLVYVRDESGATLAIMQGIAYRKKETIEEFLGTREL